MGWLAQQQTRIPFGVAVVGRVFMTSGQEAQRLQYILQMKLQLEIWSKRIDSIRTRVQNRSLVVNNDYHQNMAEWKIKKEILMIKMEEVLNHKGTNFDSLRFGAQKARLEVMSVYNKFSNIG